MAAVWRSGRFAKRVIIGVVCWGAAFGIGSAMVRAGEQPPAPVQAPQGAERSNLVGWIRDGEGGRAVSGATVFIYTAQPRVGVSAFCPSCYADCGKRVLSDTAGAFQLESLDAGLLFRVLVVCKGYEPQYVEKVDPKKGEISVTLKRVSQTPDSTRFLVRGRLVDAAGKPVVGALVEENAVKWGKSTGFGYNPTREALAISDEAGEFVFRCTKEMQETDYETGKKQMTAVSGLQVKVTARDFAPKKHWLKVDNDSAQDVPLTAGATVRGAVRDAYGRGIPGVRIMVSQTDRNAETFLGNQEIGTLPDGSFLLPNVPQGKEIGITVSMDSLKDLGRAVPVQKFSVEPTQAEIPGVALNLQAAATIKGRIILPGGAPIPDNTRLFLSREAAWDSQELIVAKNGSFSFQGVPPGETVSIFTRIRGYKFTKDVKGLQSWGSIQIEVPAKGGVIPLTVSMEPDSK